MMDSLRLSIGVLPRNATGASHALGAFPTHMDEDLVRLYEFKGVVFMRTGKEVLERAMLLLGYTNSLGELDSVKDAEIIKRGASAVIQIYNDLRRLDCLGEASLDLVNMGEVLLLSPVTVDDVMPYGVAMLIAQNEGDGDSQALYANLYNQKRSSVPHKVRRRRDVLPRGGC